MSNKRQSRTPKPPRQCIFCDQAANSGEHIWSDWMRPYFERGAHDESRETFKRIGLTKRYEAKLRDFHGHPTTRKAKAVCRGCNTGWMSRIETAAKPYIEPMLLGRRVTLNHGAQTAVLEWITLKMMIWERIDRDADHTEAAFLREQTTAFRENKSIPENLKVWLFRSNDRGMAQIMRAFASLFEARELPISHAKQANTQTLLFGAGQFIFFAVHSHLPELELGEFRQVDAKRLWPAARASVVWPPLNRMDSTSFEHVGQTLTRLVNQSPQVRSVPLY